MSRIRTIKPEFWTSEQIVECSTTARLLFIGMWNFADDGGNMPASLKTLKMQIFPGDEFTIADIQEWVDELISNQLVFVYSDNSREYWHISGWKHQKVERPSYKYPDFHEDKIVEHSSNDRRTFVAPHPPEGSLRESSLIDSPNGESCPKPIRHRTRKSYSEDFEQFWKAYPTDALMSKAEAFKAWGKLSDEDKLAAQRSIPAFRAYCGSHSDYRAVHACRYLSQRRFDGFAKTAEWVSAIPLVAVSQNSPEGQAWEQFTRATKGKGVPWTNGIWRFPTQFPPELRAAE